MVGRCHSLVAHRSSQRRHRRMVEARRAEDIQEAAGVRANYGHGQGHGGGDDGQVGRCRPVVGQVGDRVRPAAVSYGQDATTMK
jgi:hypothetical protein